MPSSQVAVYKKARSLYRTFNDYLESEDQYLSGEFWYSLEDLIRTWNETVQDIPECLAFKTLRRGFIQMQDHIHAYDLQDNPNPSADLLSSIAYVLTNINEWRNLFNVSVQPPSISSLVKDGADFSTIAKKYNLVNPSTGIGMAHMAEEEFENPGTHIGRSWVHPKEVERLANREIVDSLLTEAEQVKEPVVSFPEEGSSEDMDRFAGLYEDVDPEALIEQARSMGIVVRSNMKRETIIAKIYNVMHAQEAAQDGNG